MAEGNAPMKALREEALPIGEAAQEFGKSVTALALSLKAQGLWSPENFRKIVTDAVDSQADNINELFAEFDKEN